jgi:hypothetical protein
MASCLLRITLAAIAAIAVSAQFGPIPSTTCAGGLVCPAASVCPENYPDPLGNLLATVASGLRDFALEGRLTAVDTAAGVAAVNGLVFETSLLAGSVLTTAPLKTPADTPTTFSQLLPTDIMGPALGQIGSTIIVVGHATRLLNGCVQMQARTATYLIAENVLVGVLTGVDAVNGVRCA